MTPDRAIETAADYADAMMTARSAKNVLVLALLLMLLAQLAIFFMARYKPSWVESTVTISTTTAAARVDAQESKTRVALEYATAAIDFLGIAFSIVLSLVLLLLVMVMLVGRLIGVSRLTGAFIWCLVLVVLLFPWQAFLLNADFKIPGVLYTWDELSRNARFGLDTTTGNSELALLVLKWSRFVVFPVIAVLILLAIQVKSNRGLRQALGEADVISSTAA
jgi:hypothetical protein